MGDTELKILALRVESVEGIPFTSQELRERFRKEEDRSLRNLADTVRTLYIEKRRQQKHQRIADEFDKSPQNLGAPMLWKRKIDGIGIAV